MIPRRRRLLASTFAAYVERWPGTENQAVTRNLILRLFDGRVEPVETDAVDIEPYVREVARRERLDPEELVKEAAELEARYAGLWHEMKKAGRL